MVSGCLCTFTVLVTEQQRDARAADKWKKNVEVVSFELTLKAIPIKGACSDRLDATAEAQKKQERYSFRRT